MNGPRRGPWRVTAVEMRRALHRELVRWMIAIALLGCVVTGVAAFVSSGPSHHFGPASDHPANMLTCWKPGAGEGFLGVAAIFLVVGAAVCGASFAGAEWKAGTVTTALTWEPSRTRLHGARTLAAAVLAFVIAFGLEVLFLASTLPAVLVHGTTTGTDAGWWSALALAIVRVSLATSLIAVLAVNIATLGRNTSAALVAIAAWALVVEHVIAGLRPSLARFMITENVATFVPWRQLGNVDFERPPLLSLVSLLAYLGAVVAAATWSFTRRDIAGSS